ncbi:tight adherence pilus pseudopilin TadF [Vibrio sp. RC27]
MNLSSTKQRCSGNFTVEFAIVGIAFSLLLVFSADIIIKLAIKGKLDRMSYSAASIIKERTQLFDEEYNIDEGATAQGQDTYNYVSASLARTMNNFDQTNFGYVLDVFTFDGSTVSKTPAYKTGITCTDVEPASGLFITTSWGNTVTLYQVTLCYQTDNWFGALVGKTFNRVQSYSAVMGR